MTTRTCADVRDRLEELALGLTTEPDTSGLFDHVDRCDACRATLAALAATVDGLLELAQEVEPPVGFEARAVAGMRGAPSPRRHWALAAAAAVVISLLAVAWQYDTPRWRDRAGSIETAGGTSLGQVQLVRDPSPRVVVLLAADQDDWDGEWGCELRTADGDWVEVGRWTAADATAGVWAVRVDERHLDATAMRITTAAGRVLATADLD